jgi:proline dehydrogenase
VLRTAVLAVANRSSVRRAVTGGIGRRVALRYVAGEDLGAAVEVVRSLNAAGAEVSLDQLGENVTDPVQAKAAAAAYREVLERIEAEGLRANVSVKPTQLGLDVDEGAASVHAEEIVARAVAGGTSVTLDMEDHRYMDRTIRLCLGLAATHPWRVGLAVQTYLRRTPEDLERLISAPIHVRLCKGAYREPPSIAFRHRRAVSAAFASLTTRLLSSPAYAMIATHDEVLVDHAIAEVGRLRRAPGTFEFQMLYGVRRELQRRLVDRGLGLRVYVPFGSQWYPYLMRRIAERPANLRFFAEALLRK